MFRRFTALAADPNSSTLYRAGVITPLPLGELLGEVEGILYRSDDRGRSWSRIAPPKGKEFVSSIALGRKGDVYVYTCSGVYRSHDRGTTWVHTGVVR